MADSLAPYACDRCRSHKIACSRHRCACQRCKDEDVMCSYSRSGVIRRKRKRKLGKPASNPPSPGTFVRSHSLSKVDDGNDGNLQSHLATEIEETRETLRGLDDLQHDSRGALSSLSKACAAIWHDASELDKTGKKFFLFEDRAETWVQAFVATLNKGRPLLTAAPPKVLDDLRAARPHRVRDRSWLVMYYSIILSMVSSTEPLDEATKAKLRCNLWHALNDVRLFLEPSEANIQALTVLACHVEDFTTPSLCWILVTTACRMYQALGVPQRRLDPLTRERRIMTFWHLNLLDKGLALIFGRPPTFHRGMAREVGMPVLNELLPFQPHLASTGTPMSFGAHYLHQMLLLSRVMGDIWICLYEDAAPDDHSIGSACEELALWYHNAQRILDAAALTERPFLDARSTASIDLALCNLSFSYRYLHILLTRSSAQLKAECIDSSKRMLHLLRNMVSDSEEPYNGIVWQLLCGPFTPFLVLFGVVLSNPKDESEENEEVLAAMEELPLFLERMSLRNALATKLERVAVTLLQHAKSEIHPHGHWAGEAEPSSSIAHAALPDPCPPTGNPSDSGTIFHHSISTAISGQPQIVNHGAQPSDWATWTNDFFGDAFIDWVGRDFQV